MAENSILIEAPPEHVYAVLNDADSYADWVVGAKRIRGTDPQWPRTGTRFHHEIGAGPVVLKDSSKITNKRKDRELDLEVRFRPVGVARVRMCLTPQHDGRATVVTMTEHVTGGPVRRLWSWPVDALVHVRNAWSLVRLRRLVEARATLSA